MREDFEVYVPADVQMLPALPPFSEFEECAYTSPLGYTAMTHRAYVAGPFEICPHTGRFFHNQPGWRVVIHTKDGTVLNVGNGYFSKEDAYDGLMDYMRRWMMHRNPNLER